MKSVFSVKDVTVVTVSFNSSHIIGKMLDSLPEGVNIVVVDNGGRDKLQVTEIARKHRAKLIRLTKNQGFGQACNLGALEANTEFLFFLNPDAVVLPGAIENLIAASQRNSKKSAFNPRIENNNGSPFFKRRSVLLPRKQWLPRGWPNAEREVPILSGSAIFIRTAFFRDIQFDPQIFLYHEDDDWSLRVRKLGGKLIFVPDAKVMHQAGNSSGRDPALARFKAFHLGKSRIYALKKHNIPFPSLRSKSLAIGQMIQPQNFLAKRKRAKMRGFWEGLKGDGKTYRCAQDMPKAILLPGWKIRRETSRVFRQIFSFPIVMIKNHLATPWYDFFHSKKIKIHDGGLPFSGRVAIFLVFPKNGLLPSHKQSIAYIRENGYVPFVVSNLPLNEADLAYLRHHSWRVLERPNIGYDFGGYRDAFLSMQPHINELKRLSFLNDSCWFPIPGSKNWLKEAENLGLDYVGVAPGNPVRRAPRHQYKTIEWIFDSSLYDFHYCSFALSIGPRILQNINFRQYWKNYRLSNQKTRVIRRGEIGMTRWVIQNGFTHGATYDIRTLPEVLAECSNDDINRYAKNLIFLGEEIMLAIIKSVLPTLDANRSTDDREELILLILSTTARFGISYSLPEFLLKYHQFPFLKKAPVNQVSIESDVMLEIAQSLEGEAGRIIENEMHVIRKNNGIV